MYETKAWDKGMGQKHWIREWDKVMGQGYGTMGQGYGTGPCGKGMGQGHEVRGHSNVLLHLVGRGRPS